MIESANERPFIERSLTVAEGTQVSVAGKVFHGGERIEIPSSLGLVEAAELELAMQAAVRNGWAVEKAVKKTPRETR